MANNKEAKKPDETKESSVTSENEELEKTENPTENQSEESSDNADQTEDAIDETARKLAETEKQLATVNDAILRLRADFDNYRKRNAKIRTESIVEGKTIVITELLKTLDNFENALDVECADKSYASGMQMIHKMLCDSLTNMGVEEIPTDCPFDPNIHEAVVQDEAEGVESGTITMVMRKGYKLDGKVIRPTMVKVAK